MTGSRASLVVGTLAVAALLALLPALAGLEWYDTIVQTSFAHLHGCHGSGFVRQMSSSAVLASGACLGVLAALEVASGARPVQVGRALLWLAIALLLAQVLKLSFARDRPGAAPWTTGGMSFPSGHVANAALCLGAGLRVGRHARHRHPVARRVALLLLLAVVLAVAFSRMYLGRHWATDVTGSLLVATAFWGIVDDVRRPLLGWRGALVLLGMLAAPGLALTHGGRVALPSPATLEAHPAFALSGRRRAGPLPRSYEVAPRPAGALVQFLRVGSDDIALPLSTRGSRGAVLKLVGRPLDGFGRGCRTIALVVDGVPVAAKPLQPDWHTYAFAVPALAGGAHVLRVQLAPEREPPLAGGPILALHRLTIDGSAADLHRAELLATDAGRLADRETVGVP